MQSQKAGYFKCKQLLPFDFTQWYTNVSLFPVNTIHRPNVGSMLGQRRRRWPNIEPTLGQVYRAD